MKKILTYTLLLFIFLGFSENTMAWGFSSSNGFVSKNDFNQGVLKGFNIGELKREYDDRYLSELSETKANIVRVIVPFTFCQSVNNELPCIYEVTQKNIESLQSLNKKLEERNIKLIISAFFYEKKKGDFWTNKMLQSGMSKSWRVLADQLKDEKNIAAYELYYSPDSSEMQNTSKISEAWSIASYYMIKSIRAVDNNHVIIFQVPDGSPKNIKTLLDLNDKNVVYGFDMFYPIEITLQGINGMKDQKPYIYPLGAEYGLDPETKGIPIVIDKQALLNYLQPIIQFKQSGNAVFISSWGIVYYAPQGSAYRYMKDLLSLFSEYKLSWAYYGFRINKALDPFIAGEDPSDTARTPDANLITLLRENMESTNK